MLSRHHIRMLVVLCAGLALAGGCGRRRVPRSSAVRQATKSDLSPAELKYGIAPIPDASVVYQPDVIVVGGGADAVRALNPNGFVWTIDGNAPHAGELAVGKIVFLTGRAVGRVLDIRSEGGTLVIVVGPVAITEIIRKANISVDMPVDFGQAIAYSAPEMPGRAIPTAARSAAARPESDAGPVVTPVAYFSDPGPAGAAPPAPVPDVSSLVNFKVRPVAGNSGVGLIATSDGGGMKISTEATVHLNAPQIRAHLDIDEDAGLREATLELTGAAGLTVKFAAGTDVGLKANVSGRLQPDTDFSIPIVGLGPVPLAITVRQQFIIKTALGVRGCHDQRHGRLHLRRLLQGRLRGKAVGRVRSRRLLG